MSAFDASVVPFTAALTLMGLIALAEIIGALIGVMPSALVENFVPDLDVDLDGSMNAEAPALPQGTAGGFLTAMLNWLCVGRVPILILLVAFLAAFGVTGWVVQGFANQLIGTPVWAWLAAVPALFVAVPATRWLGLAFAKVMPKEETEASSVEGFVGKIAIVSAGTARTGLPAEAKLTDGFGQTHYVRVEPDGEDIFEPGVEVLLVKRNGSVFHAIRNTSAALSQS